MAENTVNTDKTHRGPPSCFSSLVRDMMDGGVDIDGAQPSDLDVTLAGILIRTAYKGGTVDGLRNALEKGDTMTISEKTREILDRPVKSEKIARDLAGMGITEATFRDYLVIMTLTRTSNEGTAADLYALAQLLGESENETTT